MATSKQNTPQARPTLEATLEALKSNSGGSPSSTMFYGLSRIESEDLTKISPVWADLPPGFRRKIMREMVELSETDFELDYRTMGLLGLNDPDSGVREAAIDVLWEDESLELMSRLITIALNDQVREVRASAASGLGRFILLGELGDLPENETIHAQEAAIHILNNPVEDVAVRRRALEAISNCSNPVIPDAIEAAYSSTDQQMRISSLYAMGRSCDERWGDIVLLEIDSNDPDMRYEAARAAGELELTEAVPKLAQLTVENDREIQEVAVWSLGEIGGKEATRILNLLGERANDLDDEEMMQAVDEALGSASATSGERLSWNPRAVELDD